MLDQFVKHGNHNGDDRGRSRQPTGIGKPPQKQELFASRKDLLLEPPRDDPVRVTSGDDPVIVPSGYDPVLVPYGASGDDPLLSSSGYDPVLVTSRDLLLPEMALYLYLLKITLYFMILYLYLMELTLYL